MHDLTYAKEIIAALRDKSTSITKGSKITAVNAVLSPLSHVKPDTLTETFRASIKGSEFENIALNVTVAPLEINCRSCKHVFHIDRPTLRCAKCGDTDLDIVFSREFFVESIQVSNE